MTDLKCCVKNCASNASDMCIRDNIKVGGKNAKDPGSTCCDSFKDAGSMGGAKATNKAAKAEMKTNIICDAVNCTYNHNKACKADRISVEKSNSTVHGETECSTFTM